MNELSLNKSLAAALLLFTACGPSAAERKEAIAQQNKRAVADAEMVLQAFANKTNAAPMKLSQLGLDSRFTADLQREFEGSDVAFRADLLDIVRRGPNDYELIWGDSIGLDGTLVTLQSNAAAIGEIEAEHRNQRRYLVAARIDRITPLKLTLGPCSELDCNEVVLEVNAYGRTFSIVGALLDMEPER